ncbi:acyl-coa n-acyltransferase [Lucifera butyrica]|uniref:Acyl-coa n-acyltransferase n=1 Tax=Lucifera butyrica TaxID=1351585 RepID=A0A498R2F2_9FIRM|nr:GNAT family N-acetyltransferase [Lucifera butyrica]VBB04997.1 acyl-coa n-acyltransferase [Lucifera butyrica]
MLTISPVTFADLGELALLYEELTGIKTDKNLMKNLFKKVAGNANYILVGVKDEKQRLLGSVTGIVCTDLVGKCRPFMVIENVIVGEKSRRQGIGGKLVRYIENCAKERNCSYTMLVSLAKRKEAHAFYESVGYKPGLVQGFKKYL